MTGRVVIAQYYILRILEIKNIVGWEVTPPYISRKWRDGDRVYENNFIYSHELVINANDKNKSEGRMRISGNEFQYRMGCHGRLRIWLWAGAIFAVSGGPVFFTHLSLMDWFLFFPRSRVETLWSLPLRLCAPYLFLLLHEKTLILIRSNS